MDTNDPATESQLNILKQLHYECAQTLTRVEAAQLIGSLRRHHEVRPMTTTLTGTTPPREPEWQHLSNAVKNARRALVAATISQQGDVERALATMIRRRQKFWVDTCRDPSLMETHPADVRELHTKYGCRFVTPTNEQAQEILDALDCALPDWECNHVELFYQTLELNFPEIVRRP